MADDVRGILADRHGEVLHIQLDLKYAYLNMYTFGNCITGYISDNNVSELDWFLLANKSLIKWSEE